MKLNITIDGKAYEVEVEVTEDDRPGPPPGTYYGGASAPVTLPPVAPPPGPASAPDAGNASEDKVCRSPIAGLVVRLIAQPGQHVEVNDPLMVLEAMKMETNITSPVNGSIKAINCEPGQAVQINQVLVEFE